MINDMQDNNVADTSVNKVGLVGFIISLVSIVGLGLLSLVGLVVSLVGLKRHPRGFAIAGVCFSAITCVLWVFVWVMVYQFVLTSIEMAQKPLQVEVWEYTEWVAEKYGAEEYDGDSGSLPLHPRIFEGQDMAFMATWKRDGEDLLFTVSPVNPSPDTDAPSASLRVLPGGIVVADFKTVREILASNANTWAGATQGSIFEGLLDLLESDVKAITDWVAANGGTLPDKDVALEILTKVPRTTRPKSHVKVTIETMTYLPSERQFSLDFSYSGTSGNTHSNRSAKISFTIDGMMINPVQSLDAIGGI